MIGIDMELPKSCKECQLGCVIYASYLISKNYSSDYTAPIPPDEYENKRHPLCPLVDLGKEDMSWEELV